jgi:hypothetical protein
MMFATGLRWKQRHGPQWMVDTTRKVRSIVLQTMRRVANSDTPEGKWEGGKGSRVTPESSHQREGSGIYDRSGAVARQHQGGRGDDDPKRRYARWWAGGSERRAHCCTERWLQRPSRNAVVGLRRWETGGGPQ